MPSALAALASRSIRAPTLAVSTSAAAPQVRPPPWLSFCCAFITADRDQGRRRRQGTV